jgi:hypothetical protein
MISTMSKLIVFSIAYRQRGNIAGSALRVVINLVLCWVEVRVALLFGCRQCCLLNQLAEDMVGPRCEGRRELVRSTDQIGHIA